MAQRLIEFQCAFLGKRIVVTDERWQHAQREHPEFLGTGMFEWARETLVNPDFITDDGLGDRNVKVAYYRRAPYPDEDEFIKAPVVVERRAGKVMTFHLIKSKPPHEVILWERK